MARLTPRPVPPAMQTMKPRITTGPSPRAQRSWGSPSRCAAVSTRPVRTCTTPTAPHMKGDGCFPSTRVVSTSSSALLSSAMATAAVAQQSIRPCSNAVWRWPHGRSPISWSVTTHGLPARCQTRPASNASPISACSRHAPLCRCAPCQERPEKAGASRPRGGRRAGLLSRGARRPRRRWPPPADGRGAPAL